MRYRKRFGRNGRNYHSTNDNTIRSGIFQELLLKGAELILSDISNPNGKIKRLFAKIMPKITYDDTKEIKNVKYKVIEGGKNDR